MLIHRDLFARLEIHRERHYTNDTCAWCVSQNRTKTERRYLYRYYIEYDAVSMPRYEMRHLFCGESCRKAYDS